jgi:adenosylcobinamide-GDP ribazoletransferase
MVVLMNTLLGLFEEFTLATAVLTRLPVGAAAPADGAIAAAGWAFPLVGIGVGALCAAAFFLGELLGLPDGPAALAAVAAGLALTGALHEDGLADTADGFGGGHGRDEKLAIMRDSRHGTFGILALIVSVGSRAAALAAIGDPLHAALGLIAAHALSRGTLPPLMRLLAPARPDGLAAAAGQPSPAVATVSAVIAAATALALLGPRTGALALAFAIPTLALAAVLARRQIGGYTGDVLGFFQQIGEVVMLLAAAAR